MSFWFWNQAVLLEFRFPIIVSSEYSYASLSTSKWSYRQRQSQTSKISKFRHLSAWALQHCILSSFRVCRLTRFSRFSLPSINLKASDSMRATHDVRLLSSRICFSRFLQRKVREQELYSHTDLPHGRFSVQFSCELSAHGSFTEYPFFLTHEPGMLLAVNIVYEVCTYFHGWVLWLHEKENDTYKWLRFLMPIFRSRILCIAWESSLFSGIAHFRTLVHGMSMLS